MNAQTIGRYAKRAAILTLYVIALLALATFKLAKTVGFAAIKCAQGLQSGKGPDLKALRKRMEGSL